MNGSPALSEHPALSLGTVEKLDQGQEPAGSGGDARSRWGVLKLACPLLGVKQTWPFAGNPLSRSLLRVKRTSAVALHMSAYDPKRT